MAKNCKIYNFKCEKCGDEFESLQEYDVDSDWEEVIVCPRCNYIAHKLTGQGSTHRMWSDDPVIRNEMLKKRSKEHSQKEWDNHGPNDRARAQLGMDRYSKYTPPPALNTMSGGNKK